MALRQMGRFPLRRLRLHRARAAGAAIGLLAALAPAVAFADEHWPTVPETPFFGTTLGWLWWFTVLLVLGVQLARPQGATARREPGASEAGPLIRSLAVPSALACMWALTGLHVLGSFIGVTDTVTLNRGILLLLAANALLPQPLVVAVLARGSVAAAWGIVVWSGRATLALGVAGMLVTLIWNPTLWFTLTEQAWLAAANGALAWLLVWSAALHLVTVRRRRAVVTAIHSAGPAR